MCLCANQEPPTFTFGSYPRYSVIHNAEPEKYQWGEILEILPPDPKTGPVGVVLCFRR
jgi:hypothetical protein